MTFILGMLIGALLEFINWFWLAPLIEKRKRNKPLSYLSYDKHCKEECDCYKTCYEVNSALKDKEQK